MVGAEVVVRRWRADEWAEYRALRLAALATDRLSFGSTLEREQNYPEARWRDWCRKGAQDGDDATFVAVRADGERVGMAGVFRADDVFHVWGMWVAPAARRAGVGTGLLGAVLEWVDRHPRPTSLLLDVNPTQASAVRLYRAHGFEFTGEEQSLGHDPPAVARRMARRRAAAR